MEIYTHCVATRRKPTESLCAFNCDKSFKNQRNRIIVAKTTPTHKFNSNNNNRNTKVCIMLCSYINFRAILMNVMWMGFDEINLFLFRVLIIG